MLDLYLPVLRELIQHSGHSRVAALLALLVNELGEAWKASRFGHDDAVDRDGLRRERGCNRPARAGEKYILDAAGRLLADLVHGEPAINFPLQHGGKQL